MTVLDELREWRAAEAADLRSDLQALPPDLAPLAAVAGAFHLARLDRAVAAARRVSPQAVGVSPGGVGDGPAGG